MLFSLAILPAIALLVFIYYMDKKEKEPIKFLWKLLLWGMFLVIPVIIVETIIDIFVEIITFKGSVAYAIIEGFLVAATSEELGKYLFLKKKTWNSEYFDCMFDGIVYSVFVSMGFALIENISYVLESGISVAIMRMFTSVPGHACFAVYMGYYYAKARLAINRGDKDLSKKYRRLAVIVPILLHGTYDCLLMMEEEAVGEILLFVSLFIWIIVVVTLFARAFVLVSKASKNDEYIIRYVENWNCRCGKVNHGNFCAFCGAPRFIVDNGNEPIKALYTNFADDDLML